MKTGSEDYHLAFQNSSYEDNLMIGSFLVLWGALIFANFLSDPKSFERVLGAIFVALLPLAIIAGAAFIIRLPDILTIDRTKGEFTILHRTLVTKEKEVHPVSDIKAVRLLTKTTKAGGNKRYHVSLVMHSNWTGKNKNKPMIQLTKDDPDLKYPQADAQKVADCLGLTFEEETVIQEPDYYDSW